MNKYQKEYLERTKPKPIIVPIKRNFWQLETFEKAVLISQEQIDVSHGFNKVIISIKNYEGLYDAENLEFRIKIIKS